MAKTQKTASTDTPFKKGGISFSSPEQTAHFNDDWAKKLKDGPIEPGGESFTAEQKFVAEFSEHLFQDIEPADRETLLKQAFAACLAAQ